MSDDKKPTDAEVELLVEVVGTEAGVRVLRRPFERIAESAMEVVLDEDGSDAFVEVYDTASRIAAKNDEEFRRCVKENPELIISILDIVHGGIDDDW